MWYTKALFHITNHCLVKFWSPYLDICTLKYTLSAITPPVCQGERHCGIPSCPKYTQVTSDGYLIKGAEHTCLTGCELHTAAYLGRVLMTFSLTRGPKEIVLSCLPDPVSWDVDLSSHIHLFAFLPDLDHQKGTYFIADLMISASWSRALQTSRGQIKRLKEQMRASDCFQRYEMTRIFITFKGAAAVYQ